MPIFIGLDCKSRPTGNPSLTKLHSPGEGLGVGRWGWVSWGGGSLGVGLKFINAVSVCTNHVGVCTNHVGVCTNHVGVYTNTDVVCRLSLPFLHLRYVQRQLFHGSFTSTERSTAHYANIPRHPNRLCKMLKQPKSGNQQKPIKQIKTGSREKCFCCFYLFLYDRFAVPEDSV